MCLPSLHFFYLFSLATATTGIMAKVGCQVLILVRYVLRHLRQKIERLENLEVSVDSRQGRNGFPMRKVFRPEVLGAVQDIAL